MSLYCYWAYGLRIHAELACPGLRAAPEDGTPADVIVEMLPAAKGELEPLERRYFEVRPALFRMQVRDVARYRVEEGRRIAIQPFPDASEDRIRVFLLGSVMGALLYQRGLFPLHGSAVETPWGGMVFVGPQGIGKSTLASEFHRRGYRLLSDDVCALTMSEQGVQILPALSQFRLCPDAFERLDGTREGRFEVDKFVVATGEGYRPHPMPLRAVHVLANHPEDATDAEPSFDAQHGLDRVQHLLQNLYRPRYMRGQKTQQELLRFATLIAQRTTIATVRRRRDAERIGGLVEFLESAWAERFAPEPLEERVSCAV